MCSIFRSNNECGAVHAACSERVGTMRSVYGACRDEKHSKRLASVEEYSSTEVAYTVRYLVAHGYSIYGNPRAVVTRVG